MQHRKFALSRCFMIFLVTILLGVSGCGTRTPEHRWETSNGVFKIRITEYRVPEILLDSFIHVVESSPAFTNNWDEVATYSSDDGFAVKPEQMGFVSDKVGYVYVGDRYVATIDGGKSWTTQFFSRGAVSEVNLEADGRGCLKVEMFGSGKEKKVEKYTTRNYGQQWVYDYVGLTHRGKNP